MKPFSPILFLSLLTVITFLSNGCKKDESVSPGPTTSSITGIVSDALNNAPLAGVLISTNPATTSSTTDALGRYTLSEVQVGSYTVQASKFGYDTTNSIVISVVGGSQSTSNLTIGITTRGLRAFYPFNGNANDGTANGNNGIVSGATIGSNRFGTANKAYSFDGSSSYISVANNSSIQITGDITVCAWVKTSSTPSTKGIVEKYYSGTQNDHGWLLNTYLDGKGLMEGRDGRGGPNTIKSGPSAAFADGQWHFLVGLRSANTWKIYLDGSLSNSVDAGGSAGSIESGGKITIGAFSNTNPVNGVWQGLIDDIRIYNRALSDAEIQAQYHEGGW